MSIALEKVCPWDAMLPVWTNESPVELFALFQRHQARTLDGPGLERYSQLLMGVISLQFARYKWRKSLRYVSLDARDVAQDTLVHLLRKTGVMQIQHPCWRVLIKVLNQAIYWHVMSAVQGKQRGKVKVLTASDYYKDNGRPPDEPDPRSIVEHEPEFDAHAFKRDLVGLLSSPQMLRQMVRGIHGAKRLRQKIRQAYPEIIIEILRTKWCSDKLSRLNLDAEIHAIIKARLRRQIEAHIKAQASSPTQSIQAGPDRPSDAYRMVCPARIHPAAAFCH